MGKEKIKLSMSDRLYIEQNMKKQSTVILAEAVNKPVKLVEEYIKGLPNEKQIERYMDMVESGIKAGDHIKKQSGAIILSEISSEIGDAHSVINDAPQRDMSDRIHKMKRK